MITPFLEKWDAIQLLKDPRIVIATSCTDENEVRGLQGVKMALFVFSFHCIHCRWCARVVFITLYKGQAWPKRFFGG